MTRRRTLCVWLPTWPIDRLRRARRATATPSAPQADSKPFALVESGPHGLRIAAANAPARMGGVTPGLAHADARARLPDLVTEPIDRAADARALKGLALWHRRYSPWTDVDGIDGLKLDVGGCAHLFGGEAALLHDLSSRLTGFGIVHRLGLADARAAAWGIARHAPETKLAARIAAPGETAAALAPLPVQALALEPDDALLLRRLGLKTVGQLLALPRGSVERRFRSKVAAHAVLARLDAALGRRAEPFSPLTPARARRVRLACAEPLITPEAVRIGLERLLPDLAALLEKHGEGVRRAVFQICRVDGTAARVEARAARASRDPGHLMRLFAERLDRLDPGFGVEFLILDALAVERIDAEARALADLGDASADDRDLARLADRLAARLGDGAVARLVPRASWIPERAEAAVPVGAAQASDWAAHAAATPPRPALLFASPEPAQVLAEVPDGPPARFVWRRVPRRVVRARGPERVAPEWWTDLEGRERARDYYAVEDEDGRRYWLYRDGLFEDADPGRPPAWFVHGVFP